MKAAGAAAALCAQKAGFWTWHNDVSHSLHGDSGTGGTSCHGNVITSTSPRRRSPLRHPKVSLCLPLTVRAALECNCNSYCYCNKKKANLPQMRGTCGTWVWIELGAKRRQQGGEELLLILGSESRALRGCDRTETFGYCVWHSRGCHTALFSQPKVLEIRADCSKALSLAGCCVFEDGGWFMKDGAENNFFFSFCLLSLDLKVTFKQCLEESVFCRHQYIFWIFILFHVPSRLRNEYCKQGELRESCDCLAVWPAAGGVGVLP